MSSEEKAFFEFIRRQYCVICGGVDDIDKFGDPKVTVSHVLPRGSQRRDEHFNNVIPQCLKCHRVFEDMPKSKRMEYIPLAIQYTKLFWECRTH